jgi:hypothetical protein
MSSILAFVHVLWAKVKVLINYKTRSIIMAQLLVTLTFIGLIIAGASKLTQTNFFLAITRILAEILQAIF